MRSQNCESPCFSFELVRKWEVNDHVRSEESDLGIHVSHLQVRNERPELGIIISHLQERSPNWKSLFLIHKVRHEKF